MTAFGGAAGKVAAALIGAIAGAVVVLWAQSETTERSAEPPSPSPLIQETPLPPPRAERAPAARTRILLAWSPQGLPVETERELEALPGVSEATTVTAGLDWLTRTQGADGTVLDDPKRPFAIPMEIAAVAPKEYARFVPPAERDAILSLDRNQILLARTAAELRREGPGLQLDLGDGTFDATGVVSDIATNGYEGLISRPVPRSWPRVETFVLAHIRAGRGRDGARARKAAERTVGGLLAPGEVARVRVEGETPYLRYGDAVLPQLLVKKTFGEFAAAPHPDGTLTIDPSWLATNIRSQRVPVLGEVVCHRALFPQLTQALKDAVAAGVAYTLDPAQFGGCFGPRFISRDPAGRISHHAWGIAFDVNVAENPPGLKSNLSRNLVHVIEKWGFTWGGRWLIPDGMHFEWKAWP